MQKTRSFLKWAGNKFNCLDNILPSFPKALRLIEPFTGSGAVFMNTDYPDYLLAEENNDLILLFGYVKKDGVKFIDYCEKLFIEQNNTQEQYYILRDEFNQNIPPKYRAALFLYLNRHGYNGLCRYNLKGGYNVPFGRYHIPYFPRKEMEIFHKKSQHARFVQADFRETFLQAKKGDVIYCDPPYAPLQQDSNFSSYTSRKFGEAEHMALAESAKAASKRGINVIISNHDTDFTRAQYKGAEIKSFPVSRLISSDTSNRVPAQEILAVFNAV